MRDQSIFTQSELNMLIDEYARVGNISEVEKGAFWYDLTIGYADANEIVITSKEQGDYGCWYFMSKYWDNFKIYIKDYLKNKNLNNISLKYDKGGRDE